MKDKAMRLFVAVLLVAVTVVACRGQPEEVEVKAVERGSLLCATESGNCVESWNGSDIVMYSDAGSTQTFAVDGATGDITFGGTTPLLTIGDGGAEDAGLLFDGNAQDFYLALDDSADDLIIGLGSTIGNTPTISIDENRALSIGAAGVGKDVYLYSDTSGDHFFWDTSDEVLNIIGTNAATALNVSDGNVVINDDLTVTAGAFDVTAGATTLEALTVGVAGTGADVQFFSDTSGDHLLWDSSDEALEITGTSAQNALEIVEGNLTVALGNLVVTAGDLTVGGTASWGCSDTTIGGNLTITGTMLAEDVTVTDTLDVNGDIDLDGDGFDVNITAGGSIDTDGATNLNASAGDITLEAETGSVIVKGDEAVADAIYLDANDAAGTGISAIVGTAGTFGVTGYIADFNMTGGVSIDADLASNFSAAAGDITVDAEAGSLVLIGSEAAADAILLDANDTVTSGLDVDVGSVSGMTIDGGLLDVGGGTCTIADGDNDICIAGDVEVDGNVVLANATYPVGFATAGQQAIYGSSLVTGTLAAPHGLTTVTFCLATLGEDPETGAGDAALVTVAVSGNVCTLKAWQDDWTTAATEVDVVVQWLVIGAP